jgi:hypothetical protein
MHLNIVSWIDSSLYGIIKGFSQQKIGKQLISAQNVTPMNSAGLLNLSNSASNICVRQGLQTWKHQQWFAALFPLFFFSLGRLVKPGCHLRKSARKCTRIYALARVLVMI